MTLYKPMIMKKKLLLLTKIWLCLLLCMSIQTAKAQGGADCANAELLCDAAQAFPFNATAGSSAFGSDCFGAGQPSPGWFILAVGETGSINVTITSVPALDVDYAAWGPFATPTGNCGAIGTGTEIDCSFEGGSNNEVISIPNAMAGEFYMLMITNFSGQNMTVTFAPDAADTGALGAPLGFDTANLGTFTACDGPVAVTSIPAPGPDVVINSITGPGVSGGMFDPAAAGVGTHTITLDGTSFTCPATVTTDVTVVACPVDISISDPCSCDNPLNVEIGGVVYFNEIVEICSAAGQTWELTSLTAGGAFDNTGTALALPAALTPDGAGCYTLEFWHEAGTGYDAVFTEAGGAIATQMISNSCSIPAAPAVDVTMATICEGGSAPFVATCAMLDVPAATDVLCLTMEEAWANLGPDPVQFSTECNVDGSISAVFGSPQPDGATLTEHEIQLDGVVLPFCPNGYQVVYVSNESSCASTGPEGNEPLTFNILDATGAVIATSSDVIDADATITIPALDPGFDVNTCADATVSINIVASTCIGGGCGQADKYAIDNICFSCLGGMVPPTITWYAEDAANAGNPDLTAPVFDATSGAAAGTAYDPVANGDATAAGTYNFYAACESCGCESPTTAVSVIIEEESAPMMDCPGDLCSSDAAVDLNPQDLNAVAGAVESYVVSGPSAAAFDQTTGIFDPSLATAGVYTIEYTLTSPAGECVTSFSCSFAITETPAAPVVEDYIQCLNDPVNGGAGLPVVCPSCPSFISCGTDPCNPLDPACSITTTTVVETGSASFSVIYDAATNGANNQVLAITIAEPNVPPCAVVDFAFDVAYTIDPFTPAGGNSWTSEASFTISDLSGGVITSSGTGLPGSANTGSPISGSLSGSAASTAGAFVGGVILDVQDSFDDANEDGTFSGTLTYTLTITVPAIGGPIAGPPVDGTVTWYDAATGGNVLGTGLAFDPTDYATPGVYTYFPTCSCGTCESPTSELNVTVLSDITAPTECVCGSSPFPAVQIGPLGGGLPESDGGATFYNVTVTGGTLASPTTDDPAAPTVTTTTYGVGEFPLLTLPFEGGAWTMTITDDNGCVIMDAGECESCCNAEASELSLNTDIVCSADDLIITVADAASISFPGALPDGSFGSADGIYAFMAYYTGPAPVIDPTNPLDFQNGYPPLAAADDTATEAGPLDQSFYTIFNDPAGDPTSPDLDAMYAALPRNVEVCIVGAVFDAAGAVPFDPTFGVTCGDVTQPVCFTLLEEVAYDGTETYVCQGIFANDDDEWLQITLGTFTGGMNALTGEPFDICSGTGLYLDTDADGNGSPDIATFSLPYGVNSYAPASGQTFFVKANQPWSLTVCDSQCPSALTITGEYDFPEPEIDVAGFSCSTGDPMAIFYGVNDGNNLGAISAYPNITTELLADFSASGASGALVDLGGGIAFWDPAISGVGNFEIAYTITDANGCSRTTFEEIVVQLCEPCHIFNDLSVAEDDICGGSTIDVTVSLTQYMLERIDPDGDGVIDNQIVQVGISLPDPGFTVDPFEDVANGGGLVTLVGPLDLIDGASAGFISAGVTLDHTGVTCAPEEYIVYAWLDDATGILPADSCNAFVTDVVTVWPDPATLQVAAVPNGECLVEFVVFGADGQLCGGDYNTIPAFAPLDGDGAASVDVTILSPSDNPCAVPPVVTVALVPPISAIPALAEYACLIGTAENFTDRAAFLSIPFLGGGFPTDLDGDLVPDYSICGGSGIYSDLFAFDTDGDGDADPIPFDFESGFQTIFPAGGDIGTLFDADGNLVTTLTDGAGNPVNLFVYCNEPWSLTVCDGAGCELTITGTRSCAPIPNLDGLQDAYCITDPIDFFQINDQVFTAGFASGYILDEGSFPEAIFDASLPTTISGGLTDIGGGLGTFDPGVAGPGDHAVWIYLVEDAFGDPSAFCPTGNQYIVTVYPEFDCTLPTASVICSASDPLLIDISAALDATLALPAVDDVFGGTSTVGAFFGDPSISWSGTGVTAGTLGQAEFDPSGLAPGIYTVVVEVGYDQCKTACTMDIQVVDDIPLGSCTIADATVCADANGQYNLEAMYNGSLVGGTWTATAPAGVIVSDEVVDYNGYTFNGSPLVLTMTYALGDAAFGTPADDGDCYVECTATLIIDPITSAFDAAEVYCDVDLATGVDLAGTAMPAGGTFTYISGPVGGVLNGSVVSGAAGQYTIQYEVNNGTCTFLGQQKFTIAEAITAPQPVCDCSGGGNPIVTISPSGGHPDFDGSSYTVVGIGGTFGGAATATVASGTSADLTLLTNGGDWSVIVRDDQGCEYVLGGYCDPCCDVVITNTFPVAPTCNGDAEGSITVSATSIQGLDLEYAIYGPFPDAASVPAYNGLNATAFQDLNVFSNLVPGFYLVIARDILSPSDPTGCWDEVVVELERGIDMLAPVVVDNGYSCLFNTSAVDDNPGAAHPMTVDCSANVCGAQAENVTWWTEAFGGSELSDGNPDGNAATMDPILAGAINANISETHIFWAQCECGPCLSPRTMVTFEVRALPTVKPIDGDLFVCPGSTATYAVSGAVSGNTYDWTLSSGGNITSGNGTDVIDIDWDDLPGATPGPHTLTVVETDAFGCQETYSVEVTIEMIDQLFCNDNVYATVDLECELFITPDVVLETPLYPSDSYTVAIYEAPASGNTNDAGTPIAESFINAAGEYVPATIAMKGYYLYKITHDCTGVTCWGYITAEDKTDPIITCPDDTAQKLQAAQSFTVSSVGGALFARPTGSGTTCSTSTTEDHPYVTVEFTISAAGMYTFTMAENLNIDSYALLYEGGFDPSNPCDNWIGGDDDDGPGNESELEITLNMVPGTYTLVSTDFFGGAEGEFAWTVFGEGVLNTTDGTVVDVTMTTGPAGVGELMCTDTDFIYAPDGAIFFDNIADNGIDDVSGISLPTGNPTIEENCPMYSVSYIDVLEDSNCEDAVITRTFSIVDMAGNEGVPCTQTITIRKPTLDDVDAPQDLVLACDQYSTLEEVSAEALLDAGVQDAFPVIVSCFGTNVLNDFYCNVGATYTDATEVDLCGGGFKVIRTWTIFDWCSNDAIQEVQIIKVEDTDAPVISCPGSFDLITSSPYVCETNTSLPLPTFTENCSNPVIFTVTLLETGEEFTVVEDGDLPEVTLELGSYNVSYVAMDQCGNVSNTCNTVINVTDGWGPIAVCDQNTAVSLDQLGWAEVCASTFDDGSYDGCSDNYLIRVKRMDQADDDTIPFSECVQFSCSDIDTDNNCEGVVQVRMRVYDIVGDFSELDADARYNECMVNVTVQDKLEPVISCPPSYAVNCMGDPYAVTEVSAVQTPGTYPTYTVIDGVESFVGYYPATDNCGDVEIFITINGTPDMCGEGLITKFWRAVDACGESDFCTQVVNVTATPDQVFSGDDIDNDDDDIIWPANDLDIDCVDAGISIEDTGIPTIVGADNDCADLYVGHNDQYYYQQIDACYKIIRTWKVIDWCQYSPNTGVYDGYWTYDQTIKVNDNTAPEFISDCSTKREACDDDGDCSEFVSLTAEATDNCDAELTYYWTIDAFNDGSIDFQGDSNDASGEFPFGLHRVTFTAVDDCDNSSECSYLFQVEDCKKPSPVCLVSLSAPVMPATAEIEIWANDFDASSFDDCSMPLDFRVNTVTIVNGEPVYLQAPPLTTSITLTCDNIGETLVQFWAIDQAGNYDYCTTSVFTQDSNNVCDPDPEAQIVNIAGTIETEDQEMIEAVIVDISGMASNPFNTSSNGFYTFLDVPVMNNYTITPEKDINYLNGVTTFDLVLISQHILNVNALSSPYKIIAADANNSGSVTTIDLVLLRRLILNIDTELTSNTSWRFIPADFVFPDPTNPWLTTFPEVINFNTITQDELSANFIGLKVGDVNGSSTPNQMIGAMYRNTVGDLSFSVEDQEVVANEKVTVAFKAKDFKNILGYQYTLAFNADALSYASLETTGLTLAENNFGLTQVEEGIITTSWNDTSAKTISDDTELFQITFEAKTSGRLSELLSVSSRITKAEAYTSDAELMDIALEFRSENGTTVVGGEFELYQNRPNPFNENTVISFNLDSASNATLSIMDISGRVLKVMKGNYERGYNEVVINRNDIKASGVLYYQLDTPTESATMKMILLD